MHVVLSARSVGLGLAQSGVTRGAGQNLISLIQRGCWHTLNSCKARCLLSLLLDSEEIILLGKQLCNAGGFFYFQTETEVTHELLAPPHGTALRQGNISSAAPARLSNT